MNSKQIMRLADQYILKTYTRTPVVFTKGKGMKLWDKEGREYLDFFGGWAVSGIGHAHPRVVKRIKQQADKILHVPNNFYSQPQAELAEKIIKHSFKGKVFFCNSGAEANEGAIKLARRYGNDKGRFEIITMLGSFHGRTLAALTATGQKKHHKGFNPLVAGFKYAPFNDLGAVKKKITKKTVAVLIEPIQGEGGVRLADKKYLKGLRDLCDKHKLLLIFDEVQTSMGRTGKMFCFKNYGVIPDVMTLAKSLGGGLPIGAVVVSEKYSKVLTPGTHATTFGGSPLVCAGALGVFEAIEKQKLLSNTDAMGKYLKAKLNVLRKKYPKVIKEVRGMGLMCAMQLNIAGAPIVEYCFKKRILINCTQTNILRIMPAIIVTKPQIDKVVGVLDKAMQDQRPNIMQ